MAPRDQNPAPDDTRSRLVAVGTELFGRKGFNGCGLSEVLKTAGVPKGSFYHYFSSKEEFGIALVEAACDDFKRELEPLLSDRDRSPLDRLRGLFEHIYEECRQKGPTVECLVPKLALETAHLSVPMHQAVQNAYRMWGELLADLIREGQESGEIRVDHDAVRIADTLIMLWEGATMRMQIDRSVGPLDAFLTFAFDALVRPPAIGTP